MYRERAEKGMLVECNSDKLKSVLFDFSNATGVSIDFVDKDMSFYHFRNSGLNEYCKAIQSTKEGCTRCIHSDFELFRRAENSRKAETHCCHAGLIDVAVPIYNGQELLGFIIFGQMKRDDDFSAIEKYITENYSNSSRLKEEYEKLSVYSEERISAIANIAVMLARYVLLENILKPTYERNVAEIVNYVSENLDKRLTVQEISQETHISKTALYNTFHRNFGTTVNEYVNMRRIEKSIEFLLNTDLSIEEISQKVGFCGVSYYIRLFKREKGISPLRYRKERQSENKA